MEKKKSKLRTYLLLGPVISTTILVTLWGIINAIFPAESGIVSILSKNIFPLLIGLSAVSIVPCIILYFALRSQNNKSDVIFNDKTVILGDHNYHLASLWHRWMAYTVDTFLIGIGLGMLIEIILISLSANKLFGGYSTVFYTILMYVVSYGVRIFSLTRYSTTIGKSLFGIRVVNKSGNKIDFGQAIVRTCMSYISGIVLGVGYWMAFFNEYRRTLHDNVADTYVIKYKDKSINLGVFITVLSVTFALSLYIYELK